MSIFNKIQETTKVKVWIERINEIIDYITGKETFYEGVIKPGEQDYTFVDTNSNASNRYIVTYAGVVLHNEDYVIKKENGGLTLSFVNEIPSSEAGYPFRIICVKTSI